MKKLILLILLLPFLVTGQNVRYIAPTGSNTTGDGSFGNPWFTIEYAASGGRLSAGDTLFVRGGIYNYNTQQTIDVSGTTGNEIVFINYANEEPIFDFWNYDVSHLSPQSINGIFSINQKYLKFIGLHVRRVWKINTNNGRGHGWYIQNAENITFDKCKADSIAGRGFQAHNSRNIFHYNCDVWWCADPQDDDPGNAGTGFIASGVVNESMQDTILYQGCRAWFCSDQGFSGGTGYFTTLDSCWSFANGLHEFGYTHGSSIGFKPGYTYYNVDSVAVLVKNSLAVFNGTLGIHENTASTQYRFNLRVYNNLIYNNGLYGILSTETTINTDNVVKYRNNISFNNSSYDHYRINGTDTDHIYNSWDEPYCSDCNWLGTERFWYSPATVNSDDFLALPTNKAHAVEILAAQRKADGSLPDIGDYFKLAPSSDLINAGIDVGLAYEGSAPDLGPFQFMVLNVFDNWTEYNYPLLTGTLSMPNIISSMNSQYTNLTHNSNQLKYIVESLFTSLTWDNRSITALSSGMRAAELRNAINTNNEILFNNMQELENAINTHTPIILSGWLNQERNVLTSPSSTMFVRSHNWNINILSNNLLLMYELLNSEYGIN